MSEKDVEELELEDVIDLEEVEKNQDTVLGRTSVAQIARETALRDTQDVVKGDEANEKINKGAQVRKERETEDKEK